MDWSLEKENKVVEEAKKDPERFVLLYERYFDSIYRYVYRRVNDEEMVQDLVSQTFYDALKNIGNYQFRGYPFSAWLYKIAHNNVLKWYRSNGRNQKVDLEEIVELRSDEDVVEIVNQSADRAKILQAMEVLELEEKEILRLKYFEGVSNLEIAQIMGITANNVGVKLFRALKRMKQLLI